MGELFHCGDSSEQEATYLGDSFMNGAPGSSSAVRVDHAGANISNVRRPSKIAWHEPITAPRAAPIVGSNENSNVQDGSSKTPSRAVNSCTLIAPTVISSPAVPYKLARSHIDRALAANSSPPASGSPEPHRGTSGTAVWCRASRLPRRRG